MSWPPPLSARWTALALFLLALGLHLFVAIGGTVGGLDFKSLIIADELGAILLAPLLVALLLRLPLADAFLLRSSHWGHYAIAGAAAIPLQIFGGSMQELVIESLPDPEQWRAMVEQAMEPLAQTQGFGDLALLLLGAVVLAAICEEVLFRGLLLRLLAVGGRVRTAITIAALLFALFHLDPIGLLPRALMGVYFGLLVWRSGSIFPAMLAHGANNLLAFAALPFADPAAPSPTFAQAMVIVAVSGAIFTAMVAAWWRLAPRRSGTFATADTAGPTTFADPLPGPADAPPTDADGTTFSGPADGPTDSAPRPDSTRHTDRHGS